MNGASAENAYAVLLKMGLRSVLPAVLFADPKDASVAEPEGGEGSAAGLDALLTRLPGCSTREQARAHTACVKTPFYHDSPCTHTTYPPRPHGIATQATPPIGGLRQLRGNQTIGCDSACIAQRCIGLARTKRAAPLWLLLEYSLHITRAGGQLGVRALLPWRQVSPPQIDEGVAVSTT